MSGIFISYASEDRERARMFAHALEQRGWPVWWDRKIPLGKPFDTVIEENLTRAQCVLVLWTRVSVESRWVRSEASEAAARDVLIPILLEPDVKLPLEFKMLQAANLIEWDGDPQRPAFQALLASIEPMLQDVQGSGSVAMPATDTAASVAPPPPAAGTAHARTDPSQRRAKRRQALLLILVPTVAAGIAALALASWRVPTRVQLDLVVERMSFTLAGDQAVDFPARALDFRTLSIENYDRVRFTAERLTLGPHGDAAGARRGVPGEIVLNGAAGATPVLTIAGTGADAPAAGRVEPLVLKPGSEVTLEAGSSGGPSLTVRVDGEDLSTHVLPRGMLELSATGTSIAGESRTTNSNALIMRVTLPSHAPYLAVEGARRPFVVVATLDSAEPISLGTDVSIGRIEFLKQGVGGAPQTAVAAPGQIAYPDYPGIATVALRSTDLVGAGELEGAVLSRLNLVSARGAFELRLEGVAGKIDTVSAGARRDHRLTGLDRLWHGSRAAVWFAVVLGALSASIGAYRLFREAASPK